MQFDRDELALLSRTGRVPRVSRGGEYRHPDVRGERRARHVVESSQRRIASRRAWRARILAVWTVFGSDAQSG